jgi:hypothetical protein
MYQPVANATREAGFPPLNIAPVDFVALFRQQLGGMGSPPENAELARLWLASDQFDAGTSTKGLESELQDLLHSRWGLGFPADATLADWRKRAQRALLLHEFLHDWHGDELTAFAKQYKFRGATLHGVNPTILRTGLSVSYDDVSIDAEKMRLGMTKSDWVEIDFLYSGKTHTLQLELGRQEAQKSHGLCRGDEPDVANLPAGEIYFVPTGASGAFPMRYEDGTIGLMHVSGGRIQKAELLNGDPSTVEAHNAKLISDPVTGELGELGFGTQILPTSGRDIQDEKILGTIHVATGRSAHLGGSLTPDKFAEHLNATHDDILFAPHKTSEIWVVQARMHRDGETKVLIENYEPSDYILDLRK